MKSSSLTDPPPRHPTTPGTMVFLFPDDDALRLALTSGVVPPDWATTPARAGRDDAGRPWVAPTGDAPRGVAAALRRLGVKGQDAEPPGGADVPHWLAALPLQRDPSPPPLTDQTPVLFELDDSADLAPLVGEMLRLGNDRQHVRFLAGGRALLRVIGPPYYSLLRATDRLGERAPRAYVERAPRVWVQLGWAHPLASLLRAPDGQMVLLRDLRFEITGLESADWLTLDESPWRDIYDVLEFAVPGEPTAWDDAPPAGKLAVPLRFAAGAANDAAELWVLDAADEDKVDAFVRDADERLLSRLAFAAGESDGRRVLVLRARPGKGGPPVLVLDALACRPYLKLPNLFVPVGRRLRPPLRRDAVRKLLAPDPDAVTWLAPREGDTFVAQSLPEKAFRPLEDWVEYVLDRDRDALETWVRAATFAFAPYVGKDDLVAVPARATPAEKPAKPAAKRRGEPAKPSGTPPTPPVPRPKPAAVPPPPPAAVAEPGELEKRLRAAEERFLAVDGPLDAPERLALWPELARVNAALRHPSEAALAWANALWEADGPPAEWAAEWAAVEGGSVAELDRRLVAEKASPADVRAVAATAVALAGRPEAAPRLPALLRYLERHERALPVRVAWLAWHALTHRDDPLALARGRDRALERLLTDGLSHERDLPDFLRFAGHSDGGQLRSVRASFEELRGAVQTWFTGIEPKDRGRWDQTPAYVDLLFAFGQARLGDAIAARRLTRAAADAIAAAGIEAHGVVLQGYQYRIDQVLAGRPHAGPLPAEQLEYLDHLRRDEAAQPPTQTLEVTAPRLGSYSVDRLREQSRILEPQERFNPYRQTDRAYGDNELTRELSRLPDLANAGEVAPRLRRLLQQVAAMKAVSPLRLKVYREALALAARVGEPFVAEVIASVGPLLDGLEPTLDVMLVGEQALLAEQAIFFAAHYGWGDLVLRLVGNLERIFEVPGRFEAAKRGSVRTTVLDFGGPLVGQALRSLRKLGLTDVTARLLETVEAVACQGRPFGDAKVPSAGDWPSVVRLQLSLAAGWLHLGLTERALPVLDEARALILSKPSGPGGQLPGYYVPLVCAYIGAASELPPAAALPRVSELFEPGRLARLPNTYTSSPYYSRYHLNVAEAVVLAVASEGFALGPSARRWLEDDEYLVRRRIHRDVRAAVA